MATGRFEPCPHCGRPLSWLEGVSSATLTPVCPGCKKRVDVTRATLLMIDTSRPAAPNKNALR